MKVIAFLFILLFAFSSQKLLQSDVVYAVNLHRLHTQQKAVLNTKQ